MPKCKDTEIYNQTSCGVFLFSETKYIFSECFTSGEEARIKKGANTEQDLNLF